MIFRFSFSAFPAFLSSLIFLVTFFTADLVAQIPPLHLPAASETPHADQETPPADGVNLNPESAPRDAGVPSASIVGSLETGKEKNAILKAFHAEARRERIGDELVRIDRLATANLRGLRLWQGEGVRIAALADEALTALQTQIVEKEDLILLEPLRLDIHEDLEFMELLEKRMEKACEGIQRMRQNREPGSKELHFAFEWLASIDQDAELGLKRMGHLWNLAADLVRTVHHIEQKKGSESGIARQMVKVLKELEN